MMTAEATTPPTNDPFRARLCAIKLADSRVKRLGTDLDAAKKRWQKELTKATEKFTALMPKNEADLPDDAQARLVDLYRADAERKELEGKKKQEVDKLSKAAKRAEERFFELIRSEVETTQTTLALGDVELAQGLGVSQEAAREVYAEIVEVERLGGQLDGDMLDLKARLEKANGFTALALDEDEEKDEEESRLAEPRDGIALVQ